MSFFGGIKKTVRPHWIVATLAIGVILFFQNCAPLAPQCAEDSDSPGCSLSSQSPQTSESNTTSGSTNSPNSGPGISVPGGSSGTTSTGGISLPGGSTSGSSGGTGVNLPGGSTGGSSGESGGAVNYQDQTFRITQQPTALSVTEGGAGSLTVSIYGGKSPYTYQWYKDGGALSFGTGSYLGINADRPSREGLYYVTVKDAGGLSVTSQTVRVSIIEAPGDCASGAYAALLKDTTGLTGESIRDLFIWGNNKYLQSTQHPSINYLYNNQRYLGSTYIQIFKISTTIKYKGIMNIACSNPISNIHSPMPNPGWSSGDEWGYSSNQYYNDGYGYRWSGQVTFECANKKFRLLSNTCKWEKIPVQESYF